MIAPDSYFTIVLQQYDPIEDICFDIAPPFMGIHDMNRDEAKRLCRALNEAMPAPSTRAAKQYTVIQQQRQDVQGIAVMNAAVAA